MEQKKKYSGFWVSLFRWKLEEKELKNQIENYNTLGFFKSLRKLSVGLIIFSIILSLIFVAVGIVPYNLYNLIDLFIWVILAIFIYRGRRWAIIGAMIFWTLAKANGVYLYVENGLGNPILIQLLWWAIYMDISWKTYQVEREKIEK